MGFNDEQILLSNTLSSSIKITKCFQISTFRLSVTFDWNFYVPEWNVTQQPFRIICGMGQSNLLGFDCRSISTTPMECSHHGMKFLKTNCWCNFSCANSFGSFKLSITDHFLLYYVFSNFNSKYVDYKILTMTGFELRTAGFKIKLLCQLSHNHCSTSLS